MIKRPLVWILAGYLIGMYLAWLKLSYIILFLILFLFYLILFFFLFHSTKKELLKRDRFLWCLPGFLLLGAHVMGEQLKIPEIYKAFDREVACEMSGEISMIIKKKSSTAFYLKNNQITLPGDEKYLCEHVIVFLPEAQAGEQKEENDYRIGNTITVWGTLQKFSEATNPGQFDEQLYYRIEDIDLKMSAEDITISDPSYSYYHYYLSRVKNKLLQTYERLLSGREAGTLIAMLLGEKYLLEDEIKDLYQQNGISHVLAISGLHVSLIGMFIFGILKKLRIPIKTATLISIFFIYSYGVLTNFSVSTNRAVVMMIVLMLSALVEKTYDILSALSLSALIILLQNPLQILSAGFLLSFGAVLGIAVLLPRLKQLFPTDHVIVNSLLISISAQITTTPIILYFYYQYLSYSVLTNLIILPFVTILTLTSIIAGIVGVICLPFGIFLIGGAAYILKFYEWVCSVGSQLPGNLITTGRPDPLRLLLYVVLICIFLIITKRYPKNYWAVLLVMATGLLLLPTSNVGFEVTFLDVGQGDAIYMESSNGTSYLIDGGSLDIAEIGKYRLEPFLKSQGVDKIDYAMVSHSDSDHISGLIQLIEQQKIKISTVLLPYINKKDEAYQEMESLAKAFGIRIRYIKTGDFLKDGKLRIDCLHPGIEYRPYSSNAYSMVLSVSYGAFDLLLTGDLQKDGEQLVIGELDNRGLWKETEWPVRSYEVLKVSHHGSKLSTQENFLSIVKPEISIISCGEDNYFGHPHQEVLDRLSQIGSDIRITYKTGAITIRTDGERMEIRNYID